jgi:aerobic-type carbon monoxide dehydrogenase small subunit (CoxS/CutS family)
VSTLRVIINGRAYGPMDVRDDLTMNDFLREYLGLTGPSSAAAPLSV